MMPSGTYYLDGQEVDQFSAQVAMADAAKRTGWGRETFAGMLDELREEGSVDFQGANGETQTVEVVR